VRNGSKVALGDRSQHATDRRSASIDALFEEHGLRRVYAGTDDRPAPRMADRRPTAGCAGI